MTDERFEREFAEFAQRIRVHIVPQLEQSEVAFTFAQPDGDVDILGACELGMTLFMDKPLIVVVPPGTAPPVRLRRAADLVVEADENGVLPPAVQTEILELLRHLEITP